MSEVVLNAQLREAVGKKAKLVRTSGNVPGVYYSHDEKNLNIQVPYTSLAPLVFTSKASVIELKISDGTSKKCIIRDVQFDPVSDRPVHFDLQGLREDEELTLSIPVVLVGGTPKGVREGGLLQHMMHKIEVQCLPRHIPEKIEVNVSELDINMSVHVKEIAIPNVTILDSMDSTVVAVLPPVVEKVPTPEEVAATAEAAAAEPEVLAKGKKAEEGEAEAPEQKDKEKEKK
jgi:large subunit ribosomal protein L25